MLVCIDTYTKWIEAFALVDKTAATIMRCFHEHITCRFGALCVVQSDRGTEFYGRFYHYLTSLGVIHLVISMPTPGPMALLKDTMPASRGGCVECL